MSIHAVSWALTIPFIRPGDKLILIAIANFADEWGVCWPGIDTLAELTNFSERKVRDGIATLEGAGLIATVPRRRDDGTRRTDVVVLVGFEGRRRASRSEDHAVVDLVAVDRAHGGRAPTSAKSALDSVDNPVDDTIDRQDLPVDIHVSDPPSTGSFFRDNRQILPVHIRNEPSMEPSEEEEERACARAVGCEEAAPHPARVSEDAGPAAAATCPAPEMVRRICEALGRPDLADSEWWRIEADFGRRIDGWRAMGLDDAAILETARAFGREMPEPPRGPKALEGAMVRASRIAAERRRQVAGRAAGEAVSSPQPDCRDQIEFFGRAIAAGRYVPQAAVSPRMAREMLARGLVTLEQLRARGIAA